MKMLDTMTTATPLRIAASTAIAKATCGTGPGGDRRLVVA